MLSQEQINVDLFDEVKQLKEENARLRESWKELNIQENAMQAHYNLSHKSMRMYKKYCDEITAAMNTERPAEEKTKDIRQILDALK